MRTSKLDLSVILISLLAELPGVDAVRKGKVANFTINKKIFAFTNGSAVVLKLPGSAIQDLLAKEKAAMLTMGKRTMKEWVTIRYENYGDCEKDFSLFKKAMSFVSQDAKPRKGLKK